MRKLILIVHASLDGFVAGAAGELDGFETGEENLEFVCRLAKDADAAVFGRVSFELLNGYWPDRKDQPDATWNEIAYSHWYAAAEKFVVSNSTKPAAGATVLCGDREKTIKSIKNKPGKNILVFGSPTLSQSLFRSGLVDGIWLFVNPVVFGKGIPFFSGQEAMTRFRLVQAKTFDNGEVALQYSLPT